MQRTRLWISPVTVQLLLFRLTEGKNLDAFIGLKPGLRELLNIRRRHQMRILRTHRQRLYFFVGRVITVRISKRNLQYEMHDQHENSQPNQKRDNAFSCDVLAFKPDTLIALRIAGLSHERAPKAPAYGARI